MKKTITLFLALALVVQMAVFVPAYADNEAVTNTSVTGIETNITEEPASASTDNSTVTENLTTVQNVTPEVNSTAENTTAENITAENVTAENTTPENVTAENTTPENTTPENTTPENTTPEQPEPSKEELDARFNESLKAFPSSYHAGLKALHEKYPKWIFYPADTNKKWSDAVSNEGALGRSLIHTSSISSWKSTQPGAYNWNTSTWYGLDQATYVQASEGIIAYCMDPRNYLDESQIFAFLDYSYEEGEQTLDGLKRIIAGTFLDGSFTEGDKEISYADIIMQAAAESKMNPYVLATTIVLEIGSKGTSNSISGTVSGYEGLYNYFNIGAYNDGVRSAIQRGLWWASGCPSSSGSASTSYGRPWKSRSAAIKGGASFYASNYVNAGQNTLYFKKWNVMGKNPYTHQYMTNVQGAMSEGKVFAKAYSEAARNDYLIFCIPVYGDMPESAAAKPTADGSPNYKLDSLTVDGLEISPAFSTDTLEYSLVVPEGTGSISIKAAAKDAKAKVSGTGAFTISAGETKTFEITVTAQNGDKRTYKLTAAASGRPSNSNTGSPAGVTTKYTIKDKIICGLSVPTDAGAFLKNITISGGSATVCTAGGESFSGNVGTGCKLIVKNSDGSANSEFSVVLYGDANGDGKVNSQDLLYIQKTIIGKSPALTGVYQTAADADRNGKVASVDLLTIQKSIIGVKELSQK